MTISLLTHSCVRFLLAYTMVYIVFSTSKLRISHAFHLSSRIAKFSSYSNSRRYLTTNSNSNGADVPTSSIQNRGNHNRDINFMKLALRQAQHAYREKEVPIGAVVVDEDGSVLATGRNKVEESYDATAHAEINALRNAAAFKKNWRLVNCTLYTTVEPCVMCLGAIQAFRIARVVYAAKDIRLGACGSWQPLHEIKHPIHHVVDISGGVCEEESVNLLRRFFLSLRTEKSRYSGYDEDMGRGVCVELSSESKASS